MGKERPPEGDAKTEAAVDCVRFEDKNQCTIAGKVELTEQNAKADKALDDASLIGADTASKHPRLQDDVSSEDGSDGLFFDFGFNDLSDFFESQLAGTYAEGFGDIAALGTYGLAVALILRLTIFRHRRVGRHPSGRILLPSLFD